ALADKTQWDLATGAVSVDGISPATKYGGTTRAQNHINQAVRRISTGRWTLRRWHRAPHGYFPFPRSVPQLLRLQSYELLSMLSSPAGHISAGDEQAWLSEISNDAPANSATDVVATLLASTNDEVSADPVRIYLREISKEPLLTGAEEVSLARMIKLGAE